MSRSRESPHPFRRGRRFRNSRKFYRPRIRRVPKTNSAAVSRRDRMAARPSTDIARRSLRLGSIPTRVYDGGATAEVGVAIELYSWPRSSGTRVAWALEELGVPYKYVELDPKKKEHLAPAYLAVNPHGKVPALVDDGQRFFESGAILLHLGDKYGVAAKLWPAPGGQAHADALCWSVWAIGELQPYLMQVL